MAQQSRTWLDRFTEPAVIRRRGIVEHVACRDLATGERRLVIATRDSDLCPLLDDVALLHRTLQHPNVPVLDHRGSAGGTEYVALRSAAIVDLEALLPVTMASGGMAPAAAMEFLEVVIGAVRAAHATRDPRTGGPICIGAIAGSSIVLSEEHVEVIGWGYPSTESERRVVLRDESVMHVAWEAPYGTPATPLGDLDAVGLFLHAIVPACAFPPIVLRALRGDVSDEKVAEIVRLIGRLEDSAHARDPRARSWDDYVDSLHRINELLESPADPALLRSELARLCKLWRATRGLAAAADGSWFSLRAAARVELDRRPNLRGIVAALVVRRGDAPGDALNAEDLLAAGWPGEQVAGEVGRNRVRVAVSTLRSMGLREVLLSRGDGYLLDPDVALSVE